MLHSEMIADAIGFLLIAIVVMLLAGLLGSILSKAVHKVGLGCLDSLAGAVFGFFQGALLVTVCHPGHRGVLSRDPVAYHSRGCPSISSAHAISSTQCLPRTILAKRIRRS